MRDSVVRFTDSLSSLLGLPTAAVDKAIAAAQKDCEVASTLHKQHAAAQELAQAYADLRSCELEVIIRKNAFDEATTGRLRLHVLIVSDGL